MPNTPVQDIPLVDIAGLFGDASDARDNIVRDIESACHETGFMYIRGHGIGDRTIADIRHAVVAYFEQPLPIKLPDRIERTNYRGFIPPGFFGANEGDSEADPYEGYKLHFEIDSDDPICAACDLYGLNKWPVNPPGFRNAVLNYWSECDRVANVLLQALATIMGVDAEKFLQQFEKPLTNMTLLNYPPQDSGSSRFGIHPHKDTDALTILAPDPVGGLMVRRSHQTEWIEAVCPGDALIVNTGDLLEIWSGGYFVSTPHKVVNLSGARRFSFPYFVVPRYDVVVEPLISPQPGFRRPRVHVGDVSREVWRTNWPDAVPETSRFELGTLQD